MSLATAVALAWLGLAPASEFAQQTPAAPQTSENAGSLSARLAMSSAERLIASPISDDRVRGVVRLSSVGRREAVDRLVRAMQPGLALAHDLRAKLTAARGLFPFASRESVRQLLGSWLSIEGGLDSLAGMIRDTAALALAASDDPRSIDLLVAAIVQGGAAGQAAERALLAYPPKSPMPLVSSGRPGEGLPAAVCDLVGRLGDLRAIGQLRATLAEGLAVVDADAAVQQARSSPHDRKTAAIAAARALARLGDSEHVPVVRKWLRARDANVRIAAAEILMESGSPERAQLLADWMRVDDTRAGAVHLSLRTPSVDLMPGLAVAARSDQVDLAREAIAALGRIDDERAEGALARTLADPERAWDAAFALANSAERHASDAIAGALLDSTTRRLAARAGIARALLRGDRPRALVVALRALRASRGETERAIGAFGLAVLGEASVRSMLVSGDTAVARAAARASLLIGGDAVAACAERLAGETDNVTRDALGIALAASPSAADPIATGKLAEWAEGGGAIAPLATLSLGFRDAPADKQRLDRLIASADPAIRAHAALGLAYSPEPDSSSRLARAWHFETDAAVRRAIVEALSGRSEPQRIEVLDLAARLDPDARVRETARMGLQGRLPRILERQGRSGLAWIALSANAPKAAHLLRARSCRLAEASGLVLPVVTDPDGALVVPGLVPGTASFTLASRIAQDEGAANE